MRKEVVGNYQESWKLNEASMVDVDNDRMWLQSGALTLSIFRRIVGANPRARRSIHDAFTCRLCLEPNQCGGCQAIRHRLY